MPPPQLSALALCALLPACGVYTLPELDTDTSPTTTDGPSSPTDPTTGAPTEGTCDFAGAIQPIFTASCSGCHGGANPAQALSLAPGEAHAALVGVDSTGQPGTARVAPGDPAGSYLLQKLGPTPPQGAQMPIGGSLPPDSIALISAWIAAGAPETAPFACAAPTADVGDIEIDVAGPVQVRVGEIVDVDALVTDPDGNPLDLAVTWTSSAELTLYADPDGALLGISPGTAQLHASAGGVDSPPITVEVVDHAPPAATFTQVYALTTERCAVAGCHVDGVEPGDLRFDREFDRVWEELLTEDAAQVPGLARVAPNGPTDSYLLHKLVQRAPAVGAQMPLGVPPLAAADVQTILRWILAGAPLD